METLQQDFQKKRDGRVRWNPSMTTPERKAFSQNIQRGPRWIVVRRRAERAHHAFVVDVLANRERGGVDAVFHGRGRLFVRSSDRWVAGLPVGIYQSLEILGGPAPILHAGFAQQIGSIVVPGVCP